MSEASPAGEAKLEQVAPKGQPVEAARIAARDDEGMPTQHGWMPLAARRRWIEPFVLAMVAREAYGYAILGRLEEMRISNGPLDVGLVYRTLRDLERDGLVSSSWAEESAGPRRRAYALTEAGHDALDDWAVVMRERARLIGEFNADYLEAVSRPRRADGPGPDGSGAQG